MCEKISGMEIFLLLALIAGGIALLYGFWWISVKMFLWTIEPLLKWCEETGMLKKIQDFLKK